MRVQTYRQPREFLVVSVDSAEHLLAISLQVLQLLLDDGGVQRFALVDQSLSLPEDQLNLACVQRDLLLEGLRRDEWKDGKSKKVEINAGLHDAIASNSNLQM